FYSAYQCVLESSTTPISYFFYTPHYLRNFLPFPTRRSSDLESIDCTSTAQRGCPAGLAPKLSLDFDHVRDPRKNAQKVLPLTAQDRKSTRLNSSHGSISYAVFCLKKKNTHPLDMCVGEHDSN